MENNLPSSISVYKIDLPCMTCVEKLRTILQKRDRIAEVDADLEKNMVRIESNIHVAKLIATVQKVVADAELIYYKKQGWVDPDQRNETSDEEEGHIFFKDEVEDIGANDHEKYTMFKDHDQRKDSRARKGKNCSFVNDEEEDIGPDHYKIRNTFKDHKPEKYVPSKREYFWGDVRSGMHKKYPSIPGVGSRFAAGFPSYHGNFYYPAPWPQDGYYT